MDYRCRPPVIYNLIFLCSSRFHLWTSPFQCFINDIFYFIQNSSLYNYADDNTLSFHSPDFDKVIKVHRTESNILIGLESTKMHAVDKKYFNQNTVFEIDNISITCFILVEFYVALAL